MGRSSPARWELGVSRVPRCSAGVSRLLPALYWFNYELVREWLCRQARLDEATFMISFTSGAISGVVSLGPWGLRWACLAVPMGARDGVGRRWEGKQSRHWVRSEVQLTVQLLAHRWLRC